MHIYECRPCHIYDRKPAKKQKRCPICGTPKTIRKEERKDAAQTKS